MSGHSLAFPFDPARPAASLVRADHPALHAVAQPVERFDTALHRCLERLRVVCAAADGVGIAANQVGLTAAIALAWLPPAETGAPRPEPIELINPRLLESSGEAVYEVEGCLSLPCLHGVAVRRPSFLRLQADDRHGQRRLLEAEGFLAEIISHELDHLEGRLYPTRAERVVWSPAFRIRGVR